MQASLTQRMELAVGKAQYRALTGVARRLARVRRKATVIQGVHVPYFVRRPPWILGGTTGDPLVFVHGFGGDKEGWLLTASMVGRRRALVIPDLPGFGAAGSIPKRGASAASQARVLAALLDELRMPRAHVIGNSMRSE